MFAALVVGALSIPVHSPADNHDASGCPSLPLDEHEKALAAYWTPERMSCTILYPTPKPLAHGYNAITLFRTAGQYPALRDDRPHPANMSEYPWSAMGNSREFL